MRGKLWFGAAAAALMAFGLAPAASAQTADQPGDASTTATLTDNADGEISSAGDTDWYRLQVETGRRYNLALAGLPNAAGEALDPMLAVYDAEGNQLAFNDDAEGSLNSALRYAPQASGVVYVEARAFTGEATGAYRLGVSSEVVPPDDAGNDASTRARVAAGRAATGNIEYEGDVDWYRFAARTGNRYRVTLDSAGEGGLGDPFLSVVDGDGNELAMNDDGEGSLNSALEFIPRANGDVFIVASGYGDAYTGPYALNVTAERLPRDNFTSTTSTSGRLSAGRAVTSSLDFPSDSDWYRIRLEEGQSYRFTLDASGDSPIGDPLIRMHDSRGAELAVDDDGGEGLNSYLEFTAPATGNYYVEASSFTGDATGGYTVSARVGDIPADASTDASLTPDGDYREGVLAPAGDRDWYRLQLGEGQAARVSMQVTGTPDSIGDPMLVFYGPDGAELSRDDDGGDGLNAYLEAQATAAGTYYVEARGFTDDATGRYALNVVGGEIGSGADGAEVLMANGDPRTSLIGAPGDADWFVIELVEGRPYRFNLESVDTDPLADPLLTLYDSSGTQVAADDDGGRGFNSYLNFASPTGGTYFAAVSSFDGQSTGRYSLRAVDTDVPGHAYTDEALDSADDSRISRIEMPGDFDVYRVTLEAGVTYQIDVSGHGATPLADPFLGVVQEGAGMEDPSVDAALIRDGGRRVASDDDSGDGMDARLRFRPETAGEYLLQVSGLSNTTGDYEVKIVRR